MPATYEPIASTTVGSGGSATVTFSSIAATWTDLFIVVNGTIETSVADIDVRFNSDTGTNYSYTRLYGDGSAAGSNRSSNQTSARMSYYGSLAQTPSTHIIQIMSYANTNVFKTVLGASVRAASGVDRVVGLWRSTNAITSIDVLPGLGSQEFASGATLSLYGIKASA